MAKKKDNLGQVTEFSGTGASEALDNFVEFDESAAEAAVEALAEVQAEDPDDPNIATVDEALFQARDALESQMGGFDGIAAALSEPNDLPTLGMENLVGFGIGENTVGGRYTGDLAVKVYVAEKTSPRGVADEAMVPQEVNGLPTDVEEVGDVFADSFRGRYRPAPGGSSIGHTRITAGTHGCLVVLNNNRLCCLSNNHVLANSNNAQIGDRIVQPGPTDGGRLPRDLVGLLQAFVPINFAGGANLVDAAVAWTSSRLLAGRHHCYRITPRPRNPSLNMLVRKCGRTTQHTLGLISGIGVSVRVNYGSSGVALFRNQIQIRGIGRDFSRGGDSGSVIVTAGTRQPVGLLFAGGGGVTFGNPIGPVISSLGIRRFLDQP